MRHTHTYKLYRMDKNHMRKARVEIDEREKRATRNTREDARMRGNAFPLNHSTFCATATTTILDVGNVEASRKARRFSVRMS